MTLKKAHRAHYFPTRNTPKKRDILSEKRESGMALKKRELRLKAVVLTPISTTNYWCHVIVVKAVTTSED